MEQVYLPGKIRDRIQDLMKSQKVTQAELATRIGCSESSLSRFISGKTDKLGDENIIRIARVFNVSTDFLLGEVDTPDRLNYDIAELGLSVQAARNLYTHKVNPGVVNALLENPEFSNTTNLISGYLDDELARGFAAQNQLYATVAGMLKSQPEAVDDVKKLQAPTYQADLTAIQHSFMSAVQAVKKEVGNDLSATRELTAQAMKKIYAELTKGQKKLNRKITAEQIGEAVAQSVSHLPGIDTEAVKQMFLANLGGKLAYLLLKGGVTDLKHQMDSEEYGGAPFLGAKQPVIKAHGSSKAKGIKNAIRQAKICVENDLCGTMQSALDELTTSQAD